MDNINPLELEKTLGYEFKDKPLLEKALRHSSFVNEQGDKAMEDNERLEFLGDAVLSLVVGDILMDFFPKMKEGDLSRIRANLVNETQLAALARDVDLGRFIQLGRGEIQTNGRKKNSILSDAYEAVVAAIYLDAGFDRTFSLFEPHFSRLLKSEEGPSSLHDPKSQLQELAQLSHKEIPAYSVIHESGPDHDKTFRVRLTVCGIAAEGTGKSKKSAEQDAARKAIPLVRKA